MTIPPSIRRATLFAVALLLAACGGGSDAPAPANRAPVATILQPVAGTTFRAGDTVTFSASANDAEDGSLAASRLTWWVDLHHDTHTHPFRPETTGAGGPVTIPTQGETSDNIFYRFHLRATDSTGATNEVTRDILPQKAQVTVTSVPAGLALTLDGQPITAPTLFPGVVGIERSLGAANQNLGGRRYRFDSWSDGGGATHTVSTPVANTTYTANFTDVGPVVNSLPTVALTAPAGGSAGTVGVALTLTATAADGDGSITGVEFFENGVKIGATDTTAPYSVTWTPGTTGSRSLTARATDDQGATTTSATIAVTIAAATSDTQAPTVTLTAPANLATGLAGTLNLTATASDNVGVTGVEFQVDGEPVGGTLTAAPYAVSVDSNLYASGQHIVRVRARDAAGNVAPWVVATVQFGGSRGQPAGFTKTEYWVGGLTAATALAQAPDGRLFVADQGGALRVIKNGALLSAPFITLAVDGNGERGLIGVTLHPQFASNGYVYLYYTTTENTTHNRISRFTASAANPDVVQANSEFRIADLPALSGATNHNGGAMKFGLDGKLYVAVGDNNDSAKAPLLSDPFGKMLRFNDDGSIPSDNPFFATQSGLARAIWAYGLRNPFTFAVQPGTGRIHINDVGQSAWEEINVGAPGANYGWPATEGPTSAAGVTAPLFAYGHNATSPAGGGAGGFFTGCAIAGGAFYPDTGNFPASYRGSYFFADFCSEAIGRIDLENGNAAYAFRSGTGFSSTVDLVVGIDGALYVLRRDSITRFSAP